MCVDPRTGAIYLCDRETEMIWTMENDGSLTPFAGLKHTINVSDLPEQHRLRVKCHWPVAMCFRGNELLYADSGDNVVVAIDVDSGIQRKLPKHERFSLIYGSFLSECDQRLCAHAASCRSGFGSGWVSGARACTHRRPAALGHYPDCGLFVFRNIYVAEHNHQCIFVIPVSGARSHACWSLRRGLWLTVVAVAQEQCIRLDRARAPPLGRTLPLRTKPRSRRAFRFDYVSHVCACRIPRTSLATRRRI